MSCLFASTFALSCATSSQQSQQQSPKRNSKTQSKKLTSPSNSGKPPVSIKPLHADSDYGFYVSRLSIPTNEFTEKDRATWNSYLVAPLAGTLHEAAVALGAIRESLSPNEKANQNNREVLENAQSRDTSGANSNIIAVNDSPKTFINLETRCREKGLDLVAALSKNQFLKSQYIFGMAWEAALKDHNSQMFIDNIHGVIKSEYQLWETLANRLGLIQTSNLTTTPAPEPKPGDEFKSEDTNPVTTLNPNPLPVPPLAREEAAKILASAQTFAAKEDYENAVKEARKIHNAAEIEISAKENIVNWSNKAVQNLRRLAANQYRSSSSTNDVAGKKSYLLKAKDSLQEAMVKFPESTSLETVKENLDIIEKELSRLP